MGQCLGCVRPLYYRMQPVLTAAVHEWRVQYSHVCTRAPARTLNHVCLALAHNHTRPANKASMGLSRSLIRALTLRSPCGPTRCRRGRVPCPGGQGRRHAGEGAWQPRKTRAQCANRIPRTSKGRRSVRVRSGEGGEGEWFRDCTIRSKIRRHLDSLTSLHKWRTGRDRRGEDGNNPPRTNCNNPPQCSLPAPTRPLSHHRNGLVQVPQCDEVHGLIS